MTGAREERRRETDRIKERGKHNLEGQGKKGEEKQI